MKGSQMTPDEQKQSLSAALATCKTMHSDIPKTVFILCSEGRNGPYTIIDLDLKSDRQRLLTNPTTFIRATITDNCLPEEIPDDLLHELASQLDVAFTPTGKTYNAYDLGDFITRAREALSANG